MPKSLEDISRDISELPRQDRFKLARILLDVPEEGPESFEAVEATWDREIARRLEELESGKAEAIPLEEVKKKIESRFFT